MVIVYVTYFNIHQLFCTDEFFMILTLNSDFFLKQP
jgi:hypothetical protein